MKIDEWWSELVNDPELIDFLRSVSAETLTAIDPIPGLVVWLKNHGLGVVPLDRELFERDEEEGFSGSASSMSFESVFPPTVGREITISATNRGSPLFSKKQEDVIAIGDRIRYRTGGKVMQVGEGTVIEINDGCYKIRVGLVDTDSRFVNRSWGDVLTKIEPPTTL